MNPRGSWAIAGVGLSSKQIISCLTAAKPLIIQPRLDRTALAAAGKANRVLAGPQSGLPQSVVRRVARREPPALQPCLPPLGPSPPKAGDIRSRALNSSKTLDH